MGVILPANRENLGMFIDDVRKRLEIFSMNCVPGVSERNTEPGLSQFSTLRHRGYVLLDWLVRLHNDCIPAWKSFEPRGCKPCVGFGQSRIPDLLVGSPVKPRYERRQGNNRGSKAAGVSMDNHPDVMIPHLTGVCFGHRALMTRESFMVRDQLWPALEPIVARDHQLNVRKFHR